MPLLNKVGWYLCNVVEWAAREARESGAVAVTLKLVTVGEWDGEKWIETPAADTFGDWYVVKRDGTFNTTAFDQIARAGVWPGDFTRYDDPPPVGLQVAVQVTSELYNGKQRFKPSWIYHADHTPGAGGIANRSGREKLLELQSRYGAQARASMPPAGEPARSPVAGPAGNQDDRPDDNIGIF